MSALKFITGHVIFKLRYNQVYQLKTTYVEICLFDVKFVQLAKNLADNI